MPKPTLSLSEIFLFNFVSGRIIDNLQIDNRHIDNLTNFRQIDNQQIDNLQIDNLTFSKIYSAIPLSWPHELGNWPHGILILIIGEVVLAHHLFTGIWIQMEPDDPN